MAMYSLGFMPSMLAASTYSWEAYVKGSGTVRLLECELGGYANQYSLWVGTTLGTEPIMPAKLLPWDPANTIPSMVRVCYLGWMGTPPAYGSGSPIYRTGYILGGGGSIRFPRGLLLTSTRAIGAYNESAVTYPIFNLIAEE